MCDELLSVHVKCLKRQRRETASGKKYKTKSDKADKNRILLNITGKIKTSANFRLKSLHQAHIKTVNSHEYKKRTEGGGGRRRNGDEDAEM